MNETQQVDALVEASDLMWASTYVIAMLAAHVAIGYLRRSRHAPAARPRNVMVLLAAAALAAGTMSAMLLGISAQALPYLVGYRALGVGAAMLGAAAGAGVVLFVLARWPRPVSVIGGGIVVAAASLAAQMQLVESVGLRPGFSWRLEALALALPLSISGCVGALWIACLGPGHGHRRSAGWRWAAAAMLGLAIVGGQELVLAAAGMPGQTSSDHARQLPATVACVFAGMLVPTALVLLEFDLVSRRHLRDDGRPAPTRRRRERRGRVLP